MTEKEAMALSRFCDKAPLVTETIEAAHVVASICDADGQSEYLAVSRDGMAFLLTPEKVEVTFSPPKNTGVRRVCWNHVKSYPT